jgi:type IV pilus assembly protein PilV
MLIKNIMRQQGISMIESLVSLLIISIGLLGIASLQISSIKQSSSAHWHSQAVWANYEMTDRISANSSDSFATYADIDTDNDYSMDCTANECTPAAMITADAEDWKTQVSQLPDGRGLIKSNAPDTLDVTVMWLDPAGNKNCGALDADRTCYTVTIRQ